MDRRFYVYVLFRPDGQPCYVGKGKGGRWRDHFRMGKSHYNKHLARIIAKAGGDLPCVKIRHGLTQDEANRIEIAFIAALGRRDIGTGILTNMTDGGDGKTGWVPSKRTRQAISVANTGKSPSAETKARMSAAGKNRPKALAHRMAIGAAQVGKIVPAEVCAKLSASALARSAEISERVTNYHDVMAPEAKAARALKISIATKEAMAKPEARERYLAGLKKREENRK